MESRARSIAKTFSWRFFATIITMLIAWMITGKPESGFAIGAADTLIKLFCFYFHERTWNRISMYKAEHTEISVIPSDDDDGLEKGHSGPVMLVLFSKDNPDKVIELALKKAGESKVLILVYVIKTNLGLYFVETDAGLYPALKKECETEILNKYKADAKEEIENILKRVTSNGIHIKKYIQTERFSLENNKTIHTEKPALIILSPSKKPFPFGNFFKFPKVYFHKDHSIPVMEV